MDNDRWNDIFGIKIEITNVVDGLHLMYCSRPTNQAYKVLDRLQEHEPLPVRKRAQNVSEYSLEALADATLAISMQLGVTFTDSRPNVRRILRWSFGATVLNHFRTGRRGRPGRVIAVRLKSSKVDNADSRQPR